LLTRQVRTSAGKEPRGRFVKRKVPRLSAAESHRMLRVQSGAEQTKRFCLSKALPLA
jgi:hypothetical protein